MLTIRVDFNEPTVVRGFDGVEEITATWFEGAELRQEVRLEDEDFFVAGVICGIRDNGRGKFLIVEFS